MLARLTDVPYAAVIALLAFGAGCGTASQNPQPAQAHPKSVSPATNQSPSANAQAAEPGVERKLLARHETIARFDGIAFFRCRALTAQCPDQCGHSGDMATFTVEEYLAYEKPGQYGEAKAQRHQVLVKNNLGKELVSPAIRQTIDQLKPGDRVLLSWNHYYVTKEGASYPERPIAKLEKIQPPTDR